MSISKLSNFVDSPKNSTDDATATLTRSSQTNSKLTKPAEKPILTASNSSASRYITGKSEIIGALKLLRDLRARVKISIESEKFACSAQVLDVTHAHYLLENILPREGMKILTNANSFNLVVRAQGLYIYITDCKVEQVSVERNIPYYLVALPERILYRQRRSEQRMKLPSTEFQDNAHVVLHRQSGPLNGVLSNISVGGCKVQIDQQVEPGFNKNEEISRCEIHIPKMLDLESKAIIRHAQYHHSKEIHSCGIELTEMSVQNRRRLERFIEYISRRPSTTP